LHTNHNYVQATTIVAVETAPSTTKVKLPALDENEEKKIHNSLQENLHETAVYWTLKEEPWDEDGAVVAFDKILEKSI
jgi:hypothetical protein